MSAFAPLLLGDCNNVYLCWGNAHSDTTSVLSFSLPFLLPNEGESSLVQSFSEMCGMMSLGLVSSGILEMETLNYIKKARKKVILGIKTLSFIF